MSQAPSTLTIGQVARLSGLPTKTIRYYEQVGLLPLPERADNGYRLYTRKAVDQLRFISRARGLGFSLKTVENLLGLWSDQQRSSGEVRALAQRQIDAIERKVAELQSMRATLADLVERCHGDDRPDCPILEELADEKKETKQ